MSAAAAGRIHCRTRARNIRRHESVCRIGAPRIAAPSPRRSVLKRLGSIYCRGQSPHWVKVKNPKAPGVNREERKIGGDSLVTFPQPPLSVRYASSGTITKRPRVRGPLFFLCFSRGRRTQSSLARVPLLYVPFAFFFLAFFFMMLFLFCWPSLPIETMATGK
jgi:hypothetical protein